MKKNLVLIHSTLGLPQDLDPIRESLSQEFNIYSLHLAGHGSASTLPKDFTIEQFAQDLDSYFKQHHIDDAIVFGYSVGGYIAIYHKAHFENSPISQIVTYGTRFNWSQEHLSKEMPKLNPDELENRHPEASGLLKEKHGEKWKVLMRSVAHLYQNLERLDGLTKEDLEEIHIPVLLLVGDEDRTITKEESVLVKSWLHSVQVKTISHSKHEIERMNFSEINQILKTELS
jgi:pimeloyl-ACP methyl ester carboxylesterase